jgi:predicted phage baseplate assembly protein
VEVDEVARLQKVEHHGGYTVLTFAEHLRYRYLRGSVTINANCVTATHGETVSEILGSANGAVPNQRFALSKKPLTYVPAATSSGSESTLEVRVNGVLWEEAPSLYGLAPGSEQYIVRRADDGKASIIFGDGRQGARPPTGVQNVTARYRSGAGLAGEVEAGKLSLLQSRPLGVRAVTNPLPASGAEDPEPRESARENAPMTVRTMERIVSLQDFEDFARTFAGIGKARVRVLWNGEDNLVHITVAGASGKPVSSNSELYSNLVDAIDGARDPILQVRVDTFQPRRFNLKAKVLVDERYVTEDVLQEVEAALLAAFAFARRGFGQPVTAAEVIQVIHDVDGVLAVDLDQLYLSTDPAGPSQTEPETVLASALATLNDDNTVALAELLLINPLGITLEEMEA